MSFAIVSKGYRVVAWVVVFQIIGSWFLAPILSMLLAALIFSILKKCVLTQKNSFQAALTASAPLAFLTGTTVMGMIMHKQKTFHIPHPNYYLLAPLVGFFTLLFNLWRIKNIKLVPSS